jgi:hypothetical protein
MEKKFVLQCPVCKKRKIQIIPERILKKRNQIQEEICGIVIPSHTHCSHDFVVYIDMNYSIRDTIALNHIQFKDRKQFINLELENELIAQ